jgi:hypothetical protein
VTAPGTSPSLDCVYGQDGDKDVWGTEEAQLRLTGKTRVRGPGVPTLAASALVIGLALPASAAAVPVSFSQPPGSPFATRGDLPLSVAIGDVNLDGQPDVVTANNGCADDGEFGCQDDVSVLLGNGSGGLLARGTFDADGDELSAVAIGDVNLDGDPDLVTANEGSNDITILLGNGAALPNFQSPGLNPGTGSAPVSVAIGDLNGDGNPDLAAATNSNSFGVGVLIGDGTGAFTDADALASGSFPNSIAIGDLDLDGNPDLATANTNSDDLTVLIGDGAGGFAAPRAFGAGDSPSSVAIGDLNEDGNPDLATANSSSDEVTVLIGDGAGGFATATDSPFAAGDRPLSVAIADVSLDGHTDLATANIGSDNVTVLIGDGVGGFGEAVASPFAAGDGANSVAVGDLNLDGAPDLATANSGTDSVSFLLNTTCTIPGTPGDDVLIGTPGPDVICARGGNDLLVGHGGDDVLIGEGGDDRLRGRGGDDELIGGDGDDALVGRTGDDFLDGGPGLDELNHANGATGGVEVNLATGSVTSTNLGTDTIALAAAGSSVEHVKGTRFADTLTGDGQANILNGVGGADTLIGGGGDDRLRGRRGGDELRGEDGADALLPGAGDDPLVSGGPGSDTVIYSDIIGGGVTVDLAAGTAAPFGGGNTGIDTLSADIENASGTPAADLLSAVIAGTASVLSGGGGDDSLDAADGDALDVLRGDSGADSCGADGGDVTFSCP